MVLDLKRKSFNRYFLQILNLTQFSVSSTTLAVALLKNPYFFEKISFLNFTFHQLGTKFYSHYYSVVPLLHFLKARHLPRQKNTVKTISQDIWTHTGKTVVFFVTNSVQKSFFPTMLQTPLSCTHPLLGGTCRGCKLVRSVFIFIKERSSFSGISAATFLRLTIFNFFCSAHTFTGFQNFRITRR